MRGWRRDPSAKSREAVATGSGIWGRTLRTDGSPLGGPKGGGAKGSGKGGAQGSAGHGALREEAPVPEAAEESQKLLAEEDRDRFLKVPPKPSPPTPRRRLSANMRGLLDDRYGEEADYEIARTLREIDRWLGKEFSTDDLLEHALMVKIRKLDNCVCLASVLTLGLYYFFRPTKDMALLALTSSGRVLLVKRMHNSILGTSVGTNLWVIMRFMLVLLALVVVPAAIWAWLGYHGFGDELHAGFELVLDHPEAQELRNFFANQTKVYFLLIGICWIAFVVWVWVHRQRGYGVRFKREFKASSIAAAQYVYTDGGGCCSCCRRRRRGVSLRLFFGKYPTCEELDAHLAGAVPAANAARPLQHIGRHPSDTMSGKQGTPQDPAMDENSHDEVVKQYFPCISLILLVCSLIAQGFTFASYVRELQWVLEASSYCEVGKVCTPGLCRQFAAEHEFNRPQFCDYVKLVHDDMICQGVPQPCCSGCVSGEVLVFLGGSDPIAWVGTINGALNYLTLLLALFASSVIVRHALGKPAETACLDIEFVQDFFQPDSAGFQIRTELATEFLNRVFQGAILKRGPSSSPRLGPAVTEMGLPLESRDEGVLASKSWLPDNVELVRKRDAPNWQTFFQSGHRLVAPGLGAVSTSQVRVPTQCLGFMQDEIVLRAWTETPFLTHKEFWWVTAVSVGCAVSLVYWPGCLGGPVLQYPGESNCAHDFANDPDVLGPRADALSCTMGTPLLVLCLTMLAMPFLLGIRYITFYSAQQCAIIVTTQRVFAVYFRPNWLAAVPFHIFQPGMALRVEVFRHGGQIFYGRMTSRRPPWFQRLFSRYPWTTGDLIMQSRRGVLTMQRMMGNVDELYDLVATRLSKDLEDVHFKDERGGKELPLTYGVEKGTVLTQRQDSDVSHLRWTSSVPGDSDPDKVVTVAAGKESPVYIWSFVDSGEFTSPYCSFNDVVVTTDRIRLRSRMAFKSFDCRTCCCWGMCYCSCFRRLVSAAHLPIMRSFLNFSHLAAFSTETTVDPRSMPVECPLYSALCSCATAAAHCSRARCPRARDFFRPPSTAAPRVQLWLKWLQRNAKAVQPDLVLSAKPYQLKEFTTEVIDDEEDQDAQEDSDDDACCAGRTLRRARRRPVDAEEVEELRALMQLVLLREDKRREQAARRSSEDL